MKRKPLVLILLAFLLSTLACGAGGPIARRNNGIRRAALAYELSTRGSVDEVLVAFGLIEVRDNLGFEGGNTVWLNRFAQAEYLRQRNANQTYLFLHTLNYDDGAASIIIDRGNEDGVLSRKLTLRLEEDVWRVVSDEPLESSTPPPD
jgi:hypothetical protein